MKNKLKGGYRKVCLENNIDLYGMDAIEEYGIIKSDMVFVVSPMPCGEHHVEPIARNFKEFLSLLLFCKGVSPLEQICWMNEKQFLELIQSENDSEWSERDIALKMLHTELGIVEQLDAYQYVRNLQSEFDYDTIPFSEEYSEWG